MDLQGMVENSYNFDQLIEARRFRVTMNLGLDPI